MNAKTILNNPDLMFLCLTLFIFTLYLFNSDFVDISLYTFSHYLMFSIFLTCSYRFFLILFSPVRFKVKAFIPPNFIYICALTLACYSIYKLASFVMVNSLSSFMMLRSSVSGSEAKISLGVGLSLPFVIAAWYISKLNKSKLSPLFIVLALILAAISTTKIFLFVIVFYMLFFSNVNLLKIFLALFILLSLFFLSHLILEKFSSNPDDGIIRALWNTLLVYLFGAVAAFQNLISGSVVLEKYIMFTSIENVVYLFGIENVPNSAILPWTKIGNWNTNVYTAFGSWYSLVGGFYLFFAPLLLGGYYALFFSKLGGSDIFKFYKPFLIFCLAFIYMADQFIPALLMHLIYLGMSILVSMTTVKTEVDGI